METLPNGSAVLVSIGGTTVLGQREFSPSESVNAIDTSSKDSPAREVASGRYGAEGSFTAINKPGNVDAIQALLRARALVTLAVVEGTDVKEEAEVLLTGWAVGYPDQDASVVTVNFVVSGEFTEPSS